MGYIIVVNRNNQTEPTVINTTGSSYSKEVIDMFELTPFTTRNLFYNPFRELDAVERSFFGSSSNVFKTDIVDKGDKLILEAELPGFKKEDINVDVDGDYLTISATRSSTADHSDGDYIRCERTAGSFSRSYDISSVIADEISAEYKDGILSLTMPKKKDAIPAQRHLEIK